MATKNWAVCDADIGEGRNVAVDFFVNKREAMEFAGALHETPGNEHRTFYPERLDKVFASGRPPLLLPADRMPKMPASVVANASENGA